MLLAEIVARSEKVIVSWSEPFPEVAGRLLDDVAREWGCGVAEAVGRLQPAGGIYFMMDEEDLARILAFPGAMIGSDGLPHDVFPHPRLWGTFPRVLGRYARDEGLIGARGRSTPDDRQAGRGVRAPRARGAARGGVRRFSWSSTRTRFTDTATFEDPARPAAGVRAVFVNGREVWAEGAAVPSAGAAPGRLLRRESPADRPG